MIAQVTPAIPGFDFNRDHVRRARNVLSYDLSAWREGTVNSDFGE